MQIVTIQGMKSERCGDAIWNAIRALDPCACVAVDPVGGIVRTDSVVPTRQIVAAIEAAGFRMATQRAAEPALA